jgi:hypothetical protein
MPALATRLPTLLDEGCEFILRSPMFARFTT